MAIMWLWLCVRVCDYLYRGGRRLLDRYVRLVIWRFWFCIWFFLRRNRLLLIW